MKKRSRNILFAILFLILALLLLFRFKILSLPKFSGIVKPKSEAASVTDGWNDNLKDVEALKAAEERRKKYESDLKAWNDRGISITQEYDKRETTCQNVANSFLADKPKTSCQEWKRCCKGLKGCFRGPECGCERYDYEPRLYNDAHTLSTECMNRLTEIYNSWVVAKPILK